MELSDLTELRTQIDDTVKDYRYVHMKWAKWLAWAKKQPWFDDWEIDQQMRSKDLTAHVRKASQKLLDIEPEYKIHAGTTYFNLRLQLLAEIDRLLDARKEILLELEKTYSTKDLAEAYKTSYDYMRRLLRVATKQIA